MDEAEARDLFDQDYRAAVDRYKALPPEEQAGARNPSKARADMLAGYLLAMRRADTLVDWLMEELRRQQRPMAERVGKLRKPVPASAGEPRARCAVHGLPLARVAYLRCTVCQTEQKRRQRARGRSEA